MLTKWQSCMRQKEKRKIESSKNEWHLPLIFLYLILESLYKYDLHQHHIENRSCSHGQDHLFLPSVDEKGQDRGRDLRDTMTSAIRKGSDQVCISQAINHKKTEDGRSQDFAEILDDLRNRLSFRKNEIGEKAGEDCTEPDQKEGEDQFLLCHFLPPSIKGRKAMQRIRIRIMAGTIKRSGPNRTRQRRDARNPKSSGRWTLMRRIAVCNLRTRYKWSCKIPQNSAFILIKIALLFGNPADVTLKWKPKV